MKKMVIAAVAIISVLVLASVAAVVLTSNSQPINKPKEFYVGVTYCGDSTDDAKLLVDKVANYTNLFVVQSGPFMANSAAITEIGDYTISKGLHYAVYYDTSQIPEWAQWMVNATQRWGDMFGGVYYADEPGGKMLDTQLTLLTANGSTVNKMSDGTIQAGNSNYYFFHPNGTIHYSKANVTEIPQDGSDYCILFSDIYYYPDGSVTVSDRVNKYINSMESDRSTQYVSQTFYTSQNGTDRIAQEETYQQVQSHNPIPNVGVAADLFMNKTGDRLDEFSTYWNLSSRPFPIFTSDYALYWWDYKLGYDMMLAQLGWNNSVNQEIALVRGAANLQNKSWGTTITWKYMQAPYLPGGDEMYGQMKASYEAGAKYVIIFNYAKDMSAPYGTLQDEHFAALERFWSDVVENPSVGSRGADAALVLPKNFGWGMRNPTDKIWGIWSANATSQQVWSVLQDKLSTYGSKLDIVYDDPAFPVAGKYSQVFYWDGS
jgi:hypothetical protein